MNLMLIGPRGCGKTTVGALLAARLQRPFIDLDSMTLNAFGGMSVHEVWKTRGEAAWRVAEQESLRQVTDHDHQVIALGGGTPMIDLARSLIESQRATGSSKVVYLRCPVSVLRVRLSAIPGDRPSLTGGDFIEEVATVLAAREPVYLAIADLVYDVNEEPADDVADGIIECLTGIQT